MSRIFEALRKNEQLQPDPLSEALETKERSVPPREPAISGEGMSEGVRRLRCGLNPEGRVLGSRNHHAVRERFRFLDHRLRRLQQSRSLRTLLVTSPAPKEGKTVVAMNLASTLARSSRRVLLVDADMRAPGVARALKTDVTPGLADVLEGRNDFADALVYIEDLNCYYMPAGKATLNPVELLQRPAMRDVIAHKVAYDWVILDSPPLGPFADAHCLAGLTDAVLLVVRAGMTTHEDLQTSLASLEGTEIAAVVLNAYDDPRQQSYYSYYDSSKPGLNGNSARHPAIPDSDDADL